MALRGVKVQDIDKIIIAYEPTYAIGGDASADLGYVENNIKLIKEIVSSKSKKDEINPKVLYGGSINMQNYEQYLRSDYIDGLLIGRTILDANNLLELGK